MSRIFRLTLVLVICLASWPTPAAQSAPASYCQPDAVQASGAIYRICVPPLWNGDLVVYAHGYVDPQAEIGIPEDQLRLPDGTYLPDLVNELTFAFATTSYHKNGLAIQEGLADVVDLVSIFKAKYPQTRYVYLVGASEGGLVTTLGIEKHADVFDGGLATCGPIGNFRSQVNYLGDFRVLFDYFFPGVLPFSPVNIPSQVIADWEAVYVPAVQQVILSDPEAAKQLLLVARAPFDPADPATVMETVLGLLWYNIFATNDTITTLGGQPFDNATRIYFGSQDDVALNLGVQRFSAAQAAVDEIEAHYQTSGKLTAPLVTLHTIGDPIVPYWHIPRYRVKVLVSGAALQYNNLPIPRYGHCVFTEDEILFSFALLVLKVSALQLPVDASLASLVEGGGAAVFLPGVLR